MVWAVVGMALFRNQSMRQLINKLDIMLPNEVDYVAPSAVTQARKRLGSACIHDIFKETQPSWNQQAEHPDWCGLNLLVSMVLSGEHQIRQKIMLNLKELVIKNLKRLTRRSVWSV